MFACRNADVISRHQSPLATSWPKSSPFTKTFPPGSLIPEPWTTVTM